MKKRGFTLVEMLMALLIVSVILSAALPVITSRQKVISQAQSKYNTVPIGLIAIWKYDGALPDNTWLECNGQAIPKTAEYEDLRRIYGANVPDFRGLNEGLIQNLNSYFNNDLKTYINSKTVNFPKNAIAIWGATAAVPSGWTEATEYAGYFLRGVGGNSAGIGVAQNDAIRDITGFFSFYHSSLHSPVGAFSCAGTSKTVRGDIEYMAQCAALNFNASNVVPTAVENRPLNKAVKFIRYNAPENTSMPPEFKFETPKFRYIIKSRH